MTQATEANTESLLAELRSLSDQLDAVEAEKKRLGQRWDEIEHELLDFHKMTGLKGFKGAGVSVNFDPDAMRATYEPARWNDVCKWAVDTGNQHIIQRRLTDTKVLDLVDSGIALPDGLNLERFTKVSIRRI